MTPSKDRESVEDATQRMHRYFNANPTDAIERLVRAIIAEERIEARGKTMAVKSDVLLRAKELYAEAHGGPPGIDRPFWDALHAYRQEPYLLAAERELQKPPASHSADAKTGVAPSPGESGHPSQSAPPATLPETLPAGAFVMVGPEQISVSGWVMRYVNPRSQHDFCSPQAVKLTPHSPPPKGEPCHKCGEAANVNDGDDGMGPPVCTNCYDPNYEQSPSPAKPPERDEGTPTDEELRATYNRAALPSGGVNQHTLYGDGLRALYEAGRAPLLKRIEDWRPVVEAAVAWGESASPQESDAAVDRLQAEVERLRREASK